MKVKIRRPVNKKIISEKLIKYVEEHPDAYLKEIAEVFGCHPSSVLKRLRKLRYAKKKSTFYKEQDPKQVEAYLEKIKDISKEKLVYIDETGIQTQMYRQYAHSKRRKPSIFASAASVMLELGLLQHNVKEPCLLRTPTAER